MSITCQMCDLRRKVLFRPLEATEVEAVAQLRTGQVSLRAKTDIALAGETNGTALYTLFAGWAFRYRSLADGSRQILDFLLPGDLIGLQGALLGAVTHRVQSLTPVTLCRLDGMPLAQFLDRHPALERALCAKLLQDERRADGLLTLMGRRNASQRLANLMLDLHDRLRQRGIEHGTWCHFPLQRQHLADALGLSGTHVNRSLAELRELGLASAGSNVLVIQDRDKLAEFAAYGGDADDTAQRLIL